MSEHRPKTVRVLAVDDEQNVRELYEEFLSYPTSNYRFDLTLCRQSEEAVEAVRTATEAGTPFSLAFIDIRMDSGWCMGSRGNPYAGPEHRDRHSNSLRGCGP
jgi:two-component system cell cycle sensor histidine kinase/response regulator CckA